MNMDLDKFDMEVDMTDLERHRLCMAKISEMPIDDLFAHIDSLNKEIWEVGHPPTRAESSLVENPNVRVDQIGQQLDSCLEILRKRFTEGLRGGGDVSGTYIKKLHDLCLEYDKQGSRRAHDWKARGGRIDYVLPMLQRTSSRRMEVLGLLIMCKDKPSVESIASKQASLLQSLANHELSVSELATSFTDMNSGFEIRLSKLEDDISILTTYVQYLAFSGSALEKEATSIQQRKFEQPICRDDGDFFFNLPSGL